MEIVTKFAIGDKVWTLGANLKATEFAITSISYTEEGVRYTDATTYISYPEARCFATKEELIEYISDNGNESI